MSRIWVFQILVAGFFRIVMCVKPEVRVLMEMKEVLDPANGLLISWTDNGDPCDGSSFEGVACNEYGKVANISLQGKGLTGSVPSSISGLKSLTGLYLHYNSLKGEIPREISYLSYLSDLYLNVNNLSGNIPVEIGSMDNLQVLQLCYNQLTGNIPTQIGSLKKLSVLALQSNLLTGAIPASLGDLSLLMRLDLSFNHLFGSIPVKVADAPLLEILDVRNNNLSGILPSNLKRLNGGFIYANNYDLCGIGFNDLRACVPSDSLKPNRPKPFGADSTAFSMQNHPLSAYIQTNCNQTECSTTRKSSHIAVIINVMTAILAGFVAGVFVFSCYRRRKCNIDHERKIDTALEHSESGASTDLSKDPRKSPSSLISLEYSNGWDPLSDPEETLRKFRFNLDEVESATQYFSEANLLGRSNFSSIYRGIMRDGSAVAVKCINKTRCKYEETEFLKGLKILTSLRHENLVGFRGFCCSRGRGECFLIYDFAANGNLSQRLDITSNNGNVFDWSTRVSVINGIAKGIEYLHSQKESKPSLFHQNITAEKILIDQNFTPLLSDSGLHKLLTNDVVFSTLKETAAKGYLAPEYATTGRFTEKTDIFAFGVIVFQIVSGRFDVSEITHLGTMPNEIENFIDENLSGKFSISEALKFVRIASSCIHECPHQRPNMEMVIEEFNEGSN